MPQRALIKKQKTNRSRMEILKTWMSSFVVTVVVAVAAVTMIPRSPKATILSAKAFEREISYQIEVTDQDHALDVSTLKVVLTHALGTMEMPLSLGMNVGIFENLNPSTEYVMKVYGSKGFGLENLDSKRVQTSGSPGGAIIGYQIIHQTEYEFDYRIDLLVSDPNQIYDVFRLDYGIAYGEHDVGFYESDVVNLGRSFIEIYGVSAYNAEVHLLLYGITLLDEEILLDELTFHVPYRLESSLYLDRIGQTAIYYQLYGSSSSSIDVTYRVDLYQVSRRIQSQTFKASPNASPYLGETIEIKGLKKETTYLIQTFATYINPYTLREETVMMSESEVTTLPDFTVEFVITEFETHYEVEIFVNDPSHLFQIPYFTLFEMGGEHPIYLDGEDFSFTPEANGKRATFTIEKPAVNHYRLVIGIRNTTHYTIRHILMDDNIRK